jgi:hypothetical protein
MTLGPALPLPEVIDVERSSRTRLERRCDSSARGAHPAAPAPRMVRVIKAAHTAIFFSIAAIIVLVAADGVRARPRRRTVVALTVALAESGIYGSNNQVCPLSPLAEDLGAASGSVTDIYLPDRLSRRIPVIFGTILAVGLALNLRAWRARRDTKPEEDTHG